MNKYQDMIEDLMLQKKMLNIAIHEGEFNPYEKWEWYKLQGRMQQLDADLAIVREKGKNARLRIEPFIFDNQIIVDIKQSGSKFIIPKKENYTMEEVYKLFVNFIGVISE